MCRVSKGKRRTLRKSDPAGGKRLSNAHNCPEPPTAPFSHLPTLTIPPNSNVQITNSQSTEVLHLCYKSKSPPASTTLALLRFLFSWTCSSSSSWPLTRFCGPDPELCLITVVILHQYAIDQYHQLERLTESPSRSRILALVDRPRPLPLGAQTG